MQVFERFRANAAASKVTSESVGGEVEYQTQKQRVHQRIVASLDLASAENFSAQELSQEMRPFVDAILVEEGLDLSPALYERLLHDIPLEMFGLGPLEPLLLDAEISDILVNHAHEVYVERHGRLELTNVVFADDTHLIRIVQRIVSHVGRRIDESCPMVDARLHDGSRINAIIPPLALDGPKLSIRRFRQLHCELANLIANETLSPEMADFLKAAVMARQSILISGGTGSGKTTMLNALSSCIPDDERIVTIEDSAELILQHRHVARLETRPANSENSGEYTLRDLVRNSLRMRPDRIIVGEVRGAEALDMLQAMNTGHEGSLTTIHANDTMDAISRLEMMVAMTGLELPHSVVRSYICSGISLIVHMVRLPGGARRMLRISELRKTDQGFEVVDVFHFRRTGVDDCGVATGEFATGKRPACIAEFLENGVSYNDSIFSVPLLGS
ncbi:MAG: CpaF family protein [Planctomycetales bacterium]|nr:CpaF family protein [Planctomycetales bacterium]